MIHEILPVGRNVEIVVPAKRRRIAVSGGQVDGGRPVDAGVVEFAGGCSS